MQTKRANKNERKEWKRETKVYTNTNGDEKKSKYGWILKNKWRNNNRKKSDLQIKTMPNWQFILSIAPDLASFVGFYYIVAGLIA